MYRSFVRSQCIRWVLNFSIAAAAVSIYTSFTFVIQEFKPPHHNNIFLAPHVTKDVVYFVCLCGAVPGLYA